MYRPLYFMDEDVIIVTVNYRLASFGTNIFTGITLHKSFSFLKTRLCATNNIFHRVITLHFLSGFLNTGDGIVRGNMGLKDQVMALKVF